MQIRVKSPAHFVIASVFLEMQAEAGSEFDGQFAIELAREWSLQRSFSGIITYTILFYPSLIPMKIRQFR